jgi:hypothetical protein
MDEGRFAGPEGDRSARCVPREEAGCDGELSWQWPASQTMAEETARWYQVHTRGQLVARSAGSGLWYLTELGPERSMGVGGIGAGGAGAGAVRHGR